jgi:hypothetical protein
MLNAWTVKYIIIFIYQSTIGINNVLCWTKQKELLIKGSKFKQEGICGLKQGNFSAIDEEVMVFVLEKC